MATPDSHWKFSISYEQSHYDLQNILAAVAKYMTDNGVLVHHYNAPRDEMWDYNVQGLSVHVQATRSRECMPQFRHLWVHMVSHLEEPREEDMQLVQRVRLFARQYRLPDYPAGRGDTLSARAGTAQLLSPQSQ